MENTVKEAVEEADLWEREWASVKNYAENSIIKVGPYVVFAQYLQGMIQQEIWTSEDFLAAVKATKDESEKTGIALYDTWISHRPLNGDVFGF